MIQKITNNVFVETGVPGCNHGFVVTTEGIVLIDTPQVPSLARNWKDEIAKYGKVCYLIDTEPHIDHFSGNFFFEGTIVGHEGTRAAILATSLQQLKDSLKVMAPESLSSVGEWGIRPPTITFSKELTIHLGNHTFRLMNMPGHSPFQAAVHIPEERVLFTSDNVTRTVPFLHQALPYEWLATLKRIQQIDVDILIPGHGDVCDQTFVPEMSDRIQAWIDMVKEAIGQGMSLEEAQEKLSILNRYPKLGENPRARSADRMNVARLYAIFKK